MYVLIGRSEIYSDWTPAFAGSPRSPRYRSPRIGSPDHRSSSHRSPSHRRDRYEKAKGEDRKEKRRRRSDESPGEEQRHKRRRDSHHSSDRGRSPESRPGSDRRPSSDHLHSADLSRQGLVQGHDMPYAGVHLRYASSLQSRAMKAFGYSYLYSTFCFYKKVSLMVLCIPGKL